MPTINYNATGDATATERDEVLSAARGWANGDTKVLHNVDLREDVDAVQINVSWEVANGDVDGAIDTLDTAIASLSADLPPASEAATVNY